MNELPPFLFAVDSLNDHLRQNSQNAVKAVDRISESQFVCTSVDKVVEHVFSRFEMRPLDLHVEQKVMEVHEGQVDVTGNVMRQFRERRGPHYVRGLHFTVTVPFTGDSELWRFRTSSFNFNPPRANILPCENRDEGGILEIVVSRALDIVGDGSDVRNEIDSMLGNILWYVQQSRGEVMGHNERLKSEIRRAVDNRRARIGKRAEVAAAINIPLRRNPKAPEINRLQVQHRIIRPLPARPSGPPEPAISDEEYEYILKIFRHEGRTFETTPKTYAVHDEEELRDILLAHLNTHYEGSASGETFRRCGKTDIRIEDKKRAAFVAECKVWRGAKGIDAAVDQLLSYLTWRDCKAALVVFNKHVAGFTDILKKLPDVLNSHVHCIAPESAGEAGEWRFRFSSADDPDRTVNLHVFLFNLYIGAAARKRGRKD